MIPKHRAEMTKIGRKNGKKCRTQCVCCEIDWEKCTTFGIRLLYFFILWENCHRCSHVSFVAEQQQPIFACLSHTQPTNCSGKPQFHLLLYYDVVNVSIFFLFTILFLFCEFSRVRWENEREMRSLSSHNKHKKNSLTGRPFMSIKS